MAIYHSVGPQLAQEFKDKFQGPDTPAGLSVDQIWTITKLCKLIRRSCRSNAAFNPCMELVFPGFKFQQYDTGNRNSRTGKMIQGLKITPPTGQAVTQTSDDGEDE